MSQALPVLSSCEGCGACCHTVGVPPFRIDRLVNEPIQKQVPDQLLQELLPAWEVRLLVSASPCLWYDPATARCRHYAIRPDACRDFERNSPSCAAARQEFPPAER